MNKENSTKNRFGFRKVSRKKVVVKKVRNVLRSSLVFWGCYCCVYLSLSISLDYLRLSWRIHTRLDATE
jgi:hypothetical protein